MPTGDTLSICPTRRLSYWNLSAGNRSSTARCGTSNTVAVRGRTGNMAGAVDLVELIQAAGEALRKNPPRTRGGTVCKPDFYSQVLSRNLS
jgi:hypothetical protein